MAVKTKKPKSCAVSSQSLRLAPVVRLAKSKKRLKGNPQISPVQPGQPFCLSLPFQGTSPKTSIISRRSSDRLTTLLQTTLALESCPYRSLLLFDTTTPRYKEPRILKAIEIQIHQQEKRKLFCSFTSQPTSSIRIIYLMTMNPVQLSAQLGNAKLLRAWSEYS
jgi:hypothetical protein